MIILITGLPGSGKTAHAVDMLAHDPQFAGRPKFVMGVPDLTIDYSEVPPIAEWTELRTSDFDENIQLPYFTFPENAVILLDEAQRVYRPRSVGSTVPPHVAAFETHRHNGIDFILITQQPGLIDSNIRKLVGRHIDIRVTYLGRYRYEWLGLGDPDSASSRKLAATSKFNLPKRAFSLYKSSQLHTKIKTRLPWYVWVFIITLFAGSYLGWSIYSRLQAQAKPLSVQASASAPNHKTSITTVDYVELEKPRIVGLAHTAPRYDDLTIPTQVPWPAGCYKTKSTGCKCITQQGTHYETTQLICEQIISRGIFKDFIEPTGNADGEARATALPVGSHEPT